MFEVVQDYSKGAAYVNGAYVPMSEAKIPVGDWGFVHSDVTYDVVHVWDGMFFRLEDHLDRFHRSLEGYRLKPPATREQMREILARCVALSGLSSSAQRVVDKLPANFMNVGLIHAALPRARIIHMRRHTIDACLSIYFQYFSSAHPFSNDLDDLAHYYGEYRRVTDHWHAVLPGSALLEVSYEGLIEDQEGWTRRILEFVGLPWDPRCLDFQRTGRVVTTASKWQVRQKIHASSVARWRNYERFVGPLLSLMNLDDGPRPNRLPAVRSGQA